MIPVQYFFHANATIKHGRNLIFSLEDNNGVLHATHQEKEDIFWEAYKHRLGIREFQSMLFDLSSLFPVQPDLSCLEEPFTHE